MNDIIKIILNDFSSFLKRIDSRDKKKIFSFALKLNNFNYLNAVSNFSDNKFQFFFFENLNEEYKIFAVDKLISAAEDETDCLSAAETFFNKWESVLINNWKETQLSNPPMICCSLKFDSKNSSAEWECFPAFSFFIPKFIIFNNGKNNFLLYNFLWGEFGSNYILDKLEEYLMVIFTVSDNDNSDLSTSIKKLNTDIAEDKEKWKDKIIRAKNILQKENLKKIVLSRTINFKLNKSINWKNVLKKFEERFPECFIFFYKAGNSVFFGASPERFLKVNNNKIELEAVAGSAPRSSKTAEDKNLENGLIESKKNKEEHRLVADFITSILNDYSNEVIISDEKPVRKLENIQHLITKFSSRIKNKNDIFQLINKLFPTPAVCGYPKEKSLNEIRKIEEHDRGLYSGLIGWLDFSGNCELAVSIRSAVAKDAEVTAFAGAGILADSDADEEFIETELKLEPILSLFKNEN